MVKETYCTVQYCNVLYCTVLYCIALLYLQSPLQGGKVQKSIESLASSSREAVQAERAMETLATMKGPELTEIAAAEPSSSSVVSSAEDVTARFLQPVENKNKVPLSTIFVYKGILARLSGLVKTDDCSLGILAGKDSVVRDVILTPSIDFVLNKTEVMDRWNTYEYEVLGLCALEHVKTPDSYQSDLMKLPNPNKRDLLLLASNAGAQPTAWIYQQCAKHDDQEVPFSLVSLQTGRGRGKDETFTVVHANNVGVEFQDQAGLPCPKECCSTEGCFDVQYSAVHQGQSLQFYSIMKVLQLEYDTYGNWTCTTQYIHCTVLYCTVLYCTVLYNMVHFSEGLDYIYGLLMHFIRLYISHTEYSTIQYCTLESFDVHCSRVVWFPTSVCSFTLS